MRLITGLNATTGEEREGIAQALTMKALSVFIAYYPWGSVVMTVQDGLYFP